jgi:hypothetical protein
MATTIRRYSRYENEIKQLCEAILKSRELHRETNQNEERNISERKNILNRIILDETTNVDQSNAESGNQQSEQIQNDRNVSRNKNINHTTQIVVIPPSSTIPTFKGTIFENPRQFLTRVKQHAITTNKWDEETLLEGISQFLIGNALEWSCQIYESQKRPRNWAEFTFIFLDHFNSPIRRARIDQQWKECKQGKNETFTDSLVQVQALWREKKPSETEMDLMTHIVSKMRNDLLLMCSGNRCESLDESINEAKKAE